MPGVEECFRKSGDCKSMEIAQIVESKIGIRMKLYPERENAARPPCRMSVASYWH